LTELLKEFTNGDIVDDSDTSEVLLGVTFELEKVDNKGDLECSIRSKVDFKGKPMGDIMDCPKDGLLPLLLIELILLSNMGEYALFEPYGLNTLLFLLLPPHTFVLLILYWHN